MSSEGIPEKNLRVPDIPVSSVSTEEDYSFIDILLVLTRRRKVIGWTVGLSLAIGLTLAIFSPTKYTATAKVIRESTSEEVGGLSGLAALRGFGINIGGISSGLTEENYPEILRSRELLLAVVNSPFYFNYLDTSMSLVDYQTRHPGLPKILIKSLRAVTIDLPGNILRLIQGVDSVAAVPKGVSGIVGLSRDEYESIKFLNSLFSVNVDRTSGMMTISTTTRDPLLSAQIVVTLIHNLRLRVQDLYTEKARENLEFIQARDEDARIDLEKAEGDLARFLDANQDPTTACILNTIRWTRTTPSVRRIPPTLLLRTASTAGRSSSASAFICLSIATIRWIPVSPGSIISLALKAAGGMDVKKPRRPFAAKWPKLPTGAKSRCGATANRPDLSSISMSAS